MSGHPLLDAMRAERGYTLSYHEIYARTEPKFLERYADLYRAFTLDERYLTAREREIVWVGILVADHERVGTLHLERALAIGITPEEIGDAVAVASVAHGYSALAFVEDAWSHVVSFPLWQRYDALMADAARGLTETELHLCALATHGALKQGPGFLHHLTSLYGLCVPEEQIAEAVSYLLLPKGANTMLWATDEWLQAIAEGLVTPGPGLAGVNTETRRA